MTLQKRPCGAERDQALLEAAQADVIAVTQASDISLPGETLKMQDSGGKANPGSISGHCVKRDGSAKSAYVCTAAVWKLGEAVRGRDTEWK